MALRRMEPRKYKTEVAAPPRKRPNALDDGIETEIRRWKARPESAKRKRLEPVAESFGVGGP